MKACHKRFTYFLRILSIILCALIVTVAVSTYFTALSLSDYVSKEISKVYDLQQEQVAPLLDSVLQNIDLSLMAIASNSHFQKQIKNQLQKSYNGIESTLRLVEYMKTLSQSVSMEAFSFIYFPEKDFVITQVGSGSFQRYASYRKYHFMSSVLTNSETDYAEEPYIQDRIKNSESVLYISTYLPNFVLRIMPIYSGEQVVAYAGVEFDLRALLEAKGLEIITDNVFYLYQGEECIACFNSSEENLEMLQSAMQNFEKIYDKNGHSYRVFVSTSKTNKKMKYVNLIEINLSEYRSNVERTVLFANIFVFAFALIIAFVAAKTVYNPIQQIAKSLPGDNKEGDALQYIHQSTQTMQSSINSLNDYISKLEPMASASILREIFEGTINPDNVAFSRLNQSGECAVLIFRFREKRCENDEKQRKALRNLSSFMNEVEDCTSICREDCVCCVVFCDDVAKRIDEIFSKEVNTVMTYIQTEYGMILYCVSGACEVCLGDVESNNQAIRTSYVRAVDMLDAYYKGAPNQVLLKYDTDCIALSRTAPILSQQKVAKIYEYFRVGQSQKVREYLDELFSIAKEYSDAVQIKRFFGELLNVILRAQTENKIDDASAFRQLNCYENMDDAYAMILSVANEVCSANKDKGNNVDKQVFIEKIDEFIQENYTKDVGITELAAFFGYSARYFGQLYSARIPEPFGKKLNRYRIQQAVTQIKESQKEFTDIAQSVGFNNYKSFSRAFSEQMGMTPSQYKALL